MPKPWQLSFAAECILMLPRSTFGTLRTVERDKQNETRTLPVRLEGQQRYHGKSHDYKLLVLLKALPLGL
jgi:hypothetical protein